MIHNLFQHGKSERSASARDWRTVRLEALGLAEYKADWNGEGALAVPQALIDTTVLFFKEWEKRGDPAPDSVYPLATGAVMAEWHYDDQTTVSAEIREPSKAEVLVWHPERKSQFEVVSLNDLPAKPRPVLPPSKKLAWEILIRHLTLHGRSPQADSLEGVQSSFSGLGPAVKLDAAWEAAMPTLGAGATGYQRRAVLEEQCADGEPFFSLAT